MFATTLDENQRKNYEKLLKQQKQSIFDNVGFILPDEWIEYIDVEAIGYQRPKIELKGKKYYQLLEFYSRHKKIPRPVVIYKENYLLDGYNVLIFAKDFGIKKIPVVKLENVIVLAYNSTNE